jgi:hypothetical protein
VRHLKIRSLAALAALLLLIVAPAATAAPEVGDAGDLPGTAQDLSGEGVARIDGRLGQVGDIDMYRLCVSGGGTFSATTVGGTSVDTQLFLFDPDGRGVYANDDRGGILQSDLPAGDPLTPQVQGDYLLAVGAYNIDPLSASGMIFPNETGLVGPDGPGGADPVTAWGGRANASGAYTIFVTGAECLPEDTTPPTVDLRSPADGLEVKVGDTVGVDFSCDDEGGSGLASCVGTVPDGGVLDTSEPGPVSVTVTAQDNAGNVTSVTHTVTVVVPDSTAPDIEVLSPADGAEYLLGEDVPVEYSCTDEGSGVASCAGPVPSGGFADTSSVGLHEFTVAATDNAGNAASVTVVYRVVFDFVGFHPPVLNPPDWNERQAGAAVPIKFDLGGNHGLEIVEDGWPKVAEVECGAAGEPADGDPARHPQRFKELVYRKRKQRYVLVWKTERRWAGSCRQFMLKLDDGTIKRANFVFVGHKPKDD